MSMWISSRWKLELTRQAVMISVLTDEVFFRGSIEYLRKYRVKYVSPPQQDFIVDEKQIIPELEQGATVILIDSCEKRTGSSEGAL